jgi:CRISPR-associated protein Csb2
MTVVVDVRYPFGYVHATPWGTHINEGGIEWPLSPWRLLRALVATWRTRSPDLADNLVVPVLSALASPPDLQVAPRTEASVRTYLPSESHRRGMNCDTDLVVDAFVAVAPGAGLTYRWDVDLNDAEQQALAGLVDALPYLGRAESVCTAAASFDNPAGDWHKPRTDSDGIGVRTLVPVIPLDLDDLCVSIRTMREGGRLHPPGARWVRYEVPDPIAGESAPSRRSTTASVQAARFALRGRAPVSVRHAVVVADVMRAAAMSKYGRLHSGGTSETFAGKDEAGTPLLGHRHAHWVPLDLDGDRLLDTMLVWAPGGLSRDQITALDKIRRLEFHDGDGIRPLSTLSVGYEGSGELAELGLSSVVGPATTWRSVTPFLPQRHHHSRRESHEEFLADCVARELTARDVFQRFGLESDRATSWGSFRRYRRDERLTKARPGCGFTIHFDEPVMGPLCLGQLSHFGMGRFEPCQT